MRLVNPFYLFPVVSTCLLLVLSQYTSLTNRFTSDMLVVVCTTTMIQDALHALGGDKIQAISLMGPGVDPHTYKARESDSLVLARADMIVYNGLHLEGKINSLFEHMSHTKKIVCMADGLDADQFIFHEGHADPHIWHDVKLWKQCVHYLAQQLQILDPAHAQWYATRAQSYAHQLDELDAYVRTQIASIPNDQKLLITAHDAFAYFARAYGIRVIGLQGISTDAEITTHDVQSLVNLIVTRKIKTIFVESALPTRPLRAVQDACRMQGWEVALGDSLYSDALGDPHSKAATYCDMMQYNSDIVANQLR